jgi:transposase
MRDRELYQKILGIESPWEVVDVELDTVGREVRIHVKNAESRPACPLCGRPCGRYDTRPRRWRHLDTCQYQTILVAEVPRVECSEHGVHQVAVAWSEAGSRFTALFEALVIDWLKEASLVAVARLLNLSWQAVSGIQARAVERGLARRKSRLPSHLGVDETSYQKRHEYVTVVMDQDSGTVVHVADGRGRETLDSFFDAFSWEEREQVKSVAMDMWSAYIASVGTKIPDAGDKIAYDKFHVAQHLSQAVDKVRRQENRALVAAGDQQLKGTKYLWLWHPDRLSDDTWQAFGPLRESALKTARAWAIKELAMSLWHYRSRGWARRAWLAWFSWAIRSRLEPIREVAGMIKRHLNGILNAIVLGVTNARSEGINAKIQWIKYTARGFRNRDRFRTAIYFHLGGLDLYPETLR